MAGSRFLLLLLLSVWSSLDKSPINGQSASLSKVPAPGNPAEGETVELQCEVTNIPPMGFYDIEWYRRLTNGTDVIIARNRMGLDAKYSIYSQDSSTTLSQTIVIHNVTKQDTGLYMCGARNLAESCSASTITSSLYLTVIYFPSDMYPACYPKGSFTVEEGAVQMMSCTTELGEPSELLQLIITNSGVYEWTYTSSETKAKINLNLTANASDNGNSVDCTIFSIQFPNMRRSCTIGPINVVPKIASSTTVKPATGRSVIGQTGRSPPDQCVCTTPADYSQAGGVHASPVPWMATSGVFMLLFVVSAVVNIFFIIRHRHLRSLNENTTNEPKSDPSVELQPSDKNTRYLESAAKETVKGEYTYIRAAGKQSGRQGDGYERPEETDKGQHSYQAVGKDGGQGDGYERPKETDKGQNSRYEAMGKGSGGQGDGYERPEETDKGQHQAVGKDGGQGDGYERPKETDKGQHSCYEAMGKVSSGGQGDGHERPKETDNGQHSRYEAMGKGSGEPGDGNKQRDGKHNIVYEVVQVPTV